MDRIDCPACPATFASEEEAMKHEHRVIYCPACGIFADANNGCPAHATPPCARCREVPTIGLVPMNGELAPICATCADALGFTKCRHSAAEIANGAHRLKN